MVNLPPTATSRARKSGFCIGVTCPACGGELELQDNFFVLTCGHCESVLRIVMPDTPPAFLVRPKVSGREALFQLDRFCREQRLPLVSGASVSQISCPYWKFDAVALKVRHSTYEVERAEGDDPYDNGQTEEREFKAINLVPVSVTRLAIADLPGVPASLGLRTDYLRMIPYAEENTEADTAYYSVAMSQQAVQATAFRGVVEAGRIDYANANRNRTEVFGAVASIIHFPYFRVDSISSYGMRTFYIDGVTGKVAGHAEQNPDSPIDLPQSAKNIVEFGALKVGLHRCGNCGVDLPATRSLVYQCHNCGRVSFLDCHPLEQQKLQTTQMPEAGDTSLPFWCLQLDSHDRSALRKVFGGIAESDRIMVPAFKLRNTEAMYRLCKRMSAASARITFEDLSELSSAWAAVTVPLRDALTTVEVLWQRDLAGREMRSDISSEFRPISAHLAFIPFSREQYFYVDTVLRAVTVEAGAVV